jgi:hypothetical protein
VKRRYDDDGLPVDHFRYNPEPELSRRSQPKRRPANPPDWCTVGIVTLVLIAMVILAFLAT